MKVAVVISEFPSVNETFVLDHITGLLDRGHDVHIYATAPKGEAKLHAEIQAYGLLGRTTYRDSKKFVIPGNRVVRVLKSTPLLMRGLRRNFRGTLNSLDILKFGRQAASLSAFYKVAPFVTTCRSFDIIHCHTPRNGELAVCMRGCGALKGKIVTQFHGYCLPYSKQPQKSNGFPFPNLFENGDLFLTPTQHSKLYFERAGWGYGKILIYPLGVQLKCFDSSPRPVANGEVALLSVGRLVDVKGFEYSIQAVARVLRNFPHLKYEIAGDGPLRPNLERLIRDLGVTNYVKLLGWQTREEVLQLLKKAHILLAPSITTEDGNSELSPVSVLEAMASGIPVISTRYNGLPELVRDGESGFLVAEKDAAGIADRLIHLVKRPDIWWEMGQIGRDRIEKFHNLDKQNDHLVNIYRMLLDENVFKTKGVQKSTEASLHVYS